MKKITEKILGVGVCLAEALVGILLLVNPVTFTTVIIQTAGIVVLAGGIISTVRYFMTDPVEAAKRQLLFKGLASVVIGGFLFFNSAWLLVAFPALGVLYGLAVFLGGLAKAQWAMDRLRMKRHNWLLGAIGALVSVICGLVIMANPFTSTSVLWIFAGVSLLVEALCDLIAVFYKGRDAAETEDPVVAGEIVEEPAGTDQ